MSKNSSVAPEECIEASIVPLVSKSRSGSKSSLMDIIPNFVSGLFGTPKSAKVGITASVSSETVLSVETVSQASQPVIVTREVLDSWSFNVLDYSVEELCDLMMLPYQYWNLLEEFKVPEHVFQAFLREVSGVYRKENYYHNFKHGCDVMHTVYRLISIPKLEPVFTRVELYCILVSAVSHDIGHLGVNNAYLVASKHELALKYETSPLENMHCARLFEILGKDDTNILMNLSPDQLVEARKVILTSIMGTDMVNHGRQLQQTQAFLTDHGAEVKDYCSGAKSSLDCLSTDSSRLFLLELVLHAADISNPYKPFEACEKWAVLVVEEFCSQGDRERAEGLPVSPMCDRDTMVLCNSQMGFIEFLLAPLLIAYVSLFPPLHEIVTNVNNNYAAWGDRRKTELRVENKPETNVEEECRKLDERITKFASRMAFIHKPASAAQVSAPKENQS